MRKAIRAKIIDSCPEFGTRGYQPFIADVNTVKPYFVVKFGNEVVGAKNFMGAILPVEIYVHYDRNNFDSLDESVNRIINAIDREELTLDSGGEFICEYSGISPDFVDEDRDTFVKIICFDIPQGR